MTEYVTDKITVTQNETKTPERGFNNEGVFWKAEDYNDFDFATGHIHAQGLETPTGLTDIKIDDIPISELDLMDEISWNEITSVFLAHFTSGWELIILVGTDTEGPFKVAIPTGVFLDENVPQQMRIEFAQTLKNLDNANRLSYITHNLDPVFGWADEHITITL